MAYKMTFRTDTFYRYCVQGPRKYDLIFVFTRFHSAVTIVEAELYDVNDGHFIGTWQAANMPIQQKQQFRKWIEMKFSHGQCVSGVKKSR